MKTYLNATEDPISITYQTDSAEKTLTVNVGAKLSFDDQQSNGADIEQQLVAAGATLVIQE